jgi:hypothetical protein
MGARSTPPITEMQMSLHWRYRWLRPTLGAIALLAGACQSPTDAPVHSSLVPGRPNFAVVPPQGMASTLDVGNWNIEWFGATDFGPTNETLQSQNVRDVMARRACCI